jgi:WD40 repeat protein
MRHILLLLLSVIFSAFAVSRCSAQIITYGKNKVQYNRFQWNVLEVDVVDLHFYEGEEELARTALETAETFVPYLEQIFAHRLSRRVPLIIYSSHQHFEQTNVSPYFLPEGVAGLTEHMKGRVAIPFNGSIVDFKRVIRHELVHVFQLDLVEEVFRRHPMRDLPYVPLWFTEGLADYLSEEWNSDGDMVVRDLLTSGRMPPLKSLDRLGYGYVIYKAGQSAVSFIVDQHGIDKISLIYHNVWKGRRFGEVLKRACSIDIDELGERWAYEQKLRYFPEFKDYTSFVPTSSVVPSGYFCFKPRLLNAGEADTLDLLFLSLDSGYTSIRRLTSGPSGSRKRTVLQGQRKAQFESLHPFTSRIDVFSNRLLAFVAKHHETDALFVYDLAREKTLGSHKFRDLVALSSPSWSPDGDALVFSAMSVAGQSDLYSFDRKTGVLDQLTNDWYHDAHPAWSPDGKWIVFVSDRTPYGSDGASNLFLLNVDTKNLLYLTYGPWEDKSPAWSADGKRIIFSSDRDGIFHIYSVDTEGRGIRHTNFIGAAIDPQWGPGEDEVTFVGYNAGTFRIYTSKNQADSSTAFTLEKPPPTLPWNPEESASAAGAIKATDYEPSYGLDFAQGGILIDPTLPVGQGAQFLFSDMMGDRIMLLQLSNTAQTSSEILSRFNVAVLHFNLSSRVNYGIGGYHLVGDFYDEQGFPFFERRVGAEFIARYPFSRFARVEAATALYHSTKEELIRERRGMILTNYLSLTRDTSLWLTTGPIDGERYYAALGISTDLSSGSAENVVSILDLRKYLRMGPRSAYALRFQGKFSYGADPFRFSLGGPFSLRLYPRFSLTGTRTLLLSQEIRVPLIRTFVLSTPVGGLEFPTLQGVIFLDAATAWVAGVDPLSPIGSFGLGLRLGLGPFAALKLDVGKLTDFETVGRGTEVDFSLGWNF